MNEKTTKLIQAILLCLGFNNGGELNADGNWGDNSVAAAEAYVNANNLTVAEGQDLQDVLLKAFQDDDFQFDLTAVNMEEENIKVVQAFLLTQGFNDDGKLNADGDPGPCTDAAAAVYLTSLNPVEAVQKLAEFDSDIGYFKATFLAAETADASQTSAEA